MYSTQKSPSVSGSLPLLMTSSLLQMWSCSELICFFQSLERGVDVPQLTKSSNKGAGGRAMSIQIEEINERLSDDHVVLLKKKKSPVGLI